MTPASWYELIDPRPATDAEREAGHPIDRDGGA